MTIRTIKCPGTMYSGHTLVIEQPADADWYERASAVCDTCDRRVILTGRRLPPHWLKVTVHEVVLGP